MVRPAQREFANGRINLRKTGISLEKALTSVEWFGNTSSVSIVLALDEAVKNGKLKEGDNLILFGFGGGLTYTGLIVKWGAPAS